MKRQAPTLLVVLTSLVLSAVALPFAAGCGSDAPEERAFHVCQKGARVVAAGVETTYVQCEGNWMHRTQATFCGSVLPRSEACIGSGGFDTCTTDADCMDGANGHCSSLAFGSGCECQYGCTSDADCGAGMVCLCSEPVGACVKASCTTDADCGEGRLCATYAASCGVDVEFACQAPEDDCQSALDCGSGETCGADASGHRACVPQCVF
ncbi:hypothetical protein [Polyangium aurulentum]|uniref:hypothetical protein n=1 Tax=Polyangium aurulentum TaxID=2567896 RepID=UPI00146A48C5|nr:hypothetical protein [Polyangium aurulentum]UQA62417.1 hypothetical protein E8A73_018950 [Polyangium aurulentum]